MKEVEEWIKENPRIRTVFLEKWIENLSNMLPEDRNNILDRLKRMDDKVSRIKLSVANQQGYSSYKYYFCPRQTIPCNGGFS